MKRETKTNEKMKHAEIFSFSLSFQKSQFLHMLKGKTWKNRKHNEKRQEIPKIHKNSYSLFDSVQWSKRLQFEFDAIFFHHKTVLLLELLVEFVLSLHLVHFHLLVTSLLFSSVQDAHFHFLFFLWRDFDFISFDASAEVRRDLVFVRIVLGECRLLDVDGAVLVAVDWCHLAVGIDTNLVAIGTRWHLHRFFTQAAQ